MARDKSQAHPFQVLQGALQGTLLLVMQSLLYAKGRQRLQPDTWRQLAPHVAQSRLRQRSPCQMCCGNAQANLLPRLVDMTLLKRPMPPGPEAQRLYISHLRCRPAQKEAHSGKAPNRLLLPLAMLLERQPCMHALQLLLLIQALAYAVQQP